MTESRREIQIRRGKVEGGLSRGSTSLLERSDSFSCLMFDYSPSIYHEHKLKDHENIKTSGCFLGIMKQSRSTCKRV